MESRKRPLTDDIDTSVAKKRILTGSNGSPHVNGVVGEQDEPGPGDNLEVVFAFKARKVEYSHTIILVIQEGSYLS